MSQSPFVSAPAPSSGVPWAELNGALLVVEPLSYETGITTTNGIKDAVRANVYALRSATESVDFEDALIFPLVLLGQARRSMGLKIVGRLIQGAPDAGKNPPWMLDTATPDDIAKAEAWFAARAQPTFAAAPPPAPAAPAAAPPSWAAAAPAAAAPAPAPVGAAPPWA